MQGEVKAPDHAHWHEHYDDVLESVDGFHYDDEKGEVIAGACCEYLPCCFDWDAFEDKTDKGGYGP